jgi:phage terminase large subunit GpA-like protein
MNRLAGIVAPHFRFTKAPGVTEWAEANLVLPREMAPRSPGPFSTRSRPWQRELLEPWHPESGVRRFSLAAGVQITKTTAMTIGTVYRMRYSPTPTMLVYGMSTDAAKRELSKKRLHPLINGNECLRSLRPHNPDLFGALEMMMAYAPILVTGAGSNTNLAGSTQGIVGIDEAAKIIQQSSEEAPEAHPLRLAEDRTKDFAGLEFVWKSSTPNSPNHPFWRDVEEGTFEHLFVPCPECGEFFCFEFESRKGGDVEAASKLAETMEVGKPAEYRSVVWDQDARLADGTWDEGKVRASARYVCPHCGYDRIRDEDKPAMLAAYEVRALNPRATSANRSMRIPSFYSPTRRFGDLAMAFLSRGDLFSSGLQNLYNHELARPWTDIDLRLKDEDIWDCRATGDLAYLRGTVPAKAGMLFAAADPGQAQTHWTVAMIDAEENIWVVDWGTVLGIDDLLRERMQWGYARAGATERRMVPRLGLVDSGDFTSEVYKMCQRSGRFWWPSKGSEATSGEWGQSRLAAYPGLMLYTYVDKVAKDELYDSRIHRKAGRRVYLPSDTTTDLIDGMRGQERIDKGMRARWKKVRDDHYGDCVKLLQVLSWIFSSSRAPSDVGGGVD